MRWCNVIALLVLALGCAHRSPPSLVLPYAAFGPQVAAHEVIGFEWYQWQSHGDSRPSVRDDVRVVVYDGLSLNRVQREYPVVEGKRQDYRYLSLRQALKYIDGLTNDLPSLVDTRERITTHFRHEKQ
jgi:hypothetical protein